MNLLSIKDFAEKATVKKAAISRVKGKLVLYYRDGNTKPIQIDADDPVNRFYIQSMNPSRLASSIDDAMEANVTVIPAGGREDTEFTEGLQGHMEEFAKGRAEKVKQEVKKLKIQNKHLDAQYLEKDVIYNGLILYIDSIHSSIDRYFGVIVDDIAPQILAAGEVTPAIMQASIDEGHKIIDDCKNQMLLKINRIVKDIESKK